MGACFSSFLTLFGFHDNDSYAPPLTYESWRQECQEQYQQPRKNYANGLGTPGHQMPEDSDTGHLYNVYLR